MTSERQAKHLTENVRTSLDAQESQMLRGRGAPTESPSVLEAVSVVLKAHSLARARGERPPPLSPLVRQVRLVAGLLRNHLPRLDEPRSQAWALAVLDEVPARLREGETVGPAANDEAPAELLGAWFTRREVESVCRAYAKQLGRDDWPVLSEVVEGLRGQRRRRVEAAKQDLTKAALPAVATETEAEKARKHRLGVVWAEVTSDALAGLLPGGARAVEAEAQARLEMTDEARRERRTALRRANDTCAEGRGGHTR